MASPDAPPAQRPTPRAALLAIVGLALAVRALVGVWANGRGEMEGLSLYYQHEAMALVAGYGFVHMPVGKEPQVDLIQLAMRLEAQGRKLEPSAAPRKDPARWRPSSLHPPGYAGFLACVYRVLGPPLYPKAKAIQLLLDALGCLLVFQLGARLVGRPAGLFAATLYALFPPIAYLVTSRVADAFMPVLYLAWFASFVRALDTRNFGWYALAGALLGLTCLVRPDSLLVPTFLVLAVLLGRDRVRRLAGVGVLVLAMLAVLTPWGLRNQRVTGHFEFASSSAGVTLFESIGQFPNPYGIVFDDMAMADSARAAGFESFDDPGANRYFMGRVKQIVRERPGLLLGHMLRRVPLGIAPLYHWGFDNRAFAGGGSFYDFWRTERIGPLKAFVRHPLRILAAYWDRLIFGVASLALFVAGLALLVVERRHAFVVLLLWLPYAYLVASHLPLMLGARLLVPGLFGQFVMLGYWYERLVLRRPATIHDIG